MGEKLGETHETSMPGFNTQVEENQLNQDIARNNGASQARKLGQKETTEKLVHKCKESGQQNGGTGTTGPGSYRDYRNLME